MGTSVGQVVRGRVVFGVVIGKIFGTFFPIETELSLGFTTSEPMDLHANHFDVACDDGVINKSRWEFLAVASPFQRVCCVCGPCCVLRALMYSTVTSALVAKVMTN